MRHRKNFKKSAFLSVLRDLIQRPFHFSIFSKSVTQKSLLNEQHNDLFQWKICQSISYRGWYVFSVFKKYPKNAICSMQFDTHNHAQRCTRHPNVGECTFGPRSWEDFFKCRLRGDVFCRPSRKKHPSPWGRGLPVNIAHGRDTQKRSIRDSGWIHFWTSIVRRGHCPALICEICFRSLIVEGTNDVP